MTPEIAAGTRRQREQQFRLLVENVLEYAIFMLDPEGHIVSWNAGAERIKGYTADEIIGTHFSIFYPAEAIARRWPEHELEVAAKNGRYEEEGWRIRKDGSRFWANVVITALRGEAGELVGFVKVTRDLTERYAVETVTEAALSHLAHEQLLPELLRRVSDAIGADTGAILLAEPDGVLMARASWGLEDEVERGVRVPLGHGFAGRIAQERRPIVLDDVEHSNVLNPILREKGIRSLLGVPLLIEGKVSGVLHVGRVQRRPFLDRDVHLLEIVADRIALAIDRARLLEAARVAREEADVAEAMVKERDEFLSIAAHELKTPMTGVKAAAQLLLRHADRTGAASDPIQHRALATIDRQVTKLGHLVVQLLETVRAQAGELALDRTESDLVEIVRGIATEIQDTTTHHRIALDLPETFPVSIDPLRFEQVITNLLDNAVKYSPDGGTIEVSLRRQSPTTALLSVRDHGIGVGPEHRPQLFQRFYQAHRDRSGMGLGLYITRRIVERHGGTIYAEFPRDGGTRFVVILPL